MRGGMMGMMRGGGMMGMMESCGTAYSEGRIAFLKAELAGFYRPAKGSLGGLCRGHHEES